MGGADFDPMLTGRGRIIPAMEGNVLGTSIRPTSLAEAARRHGRFYARYLHAARRAAGKRVLDIACGAGYGSACMARAADSVLGLDLDAELVSTAAARYRRPNLRYGVHDLHQPLPGGPYDLITSFETFEHVRDPQLCLERLRDALAAGGTLMLSIPNGTKELREQKDAPYHQVHFSAEDFRGLIGSRFPGAEFFSQLYRKDVWHYLRKLTGGGGHHARNYIFAPGLLEQAKTWLAICPKGD